MLDRETRHVLVVVVALDTEDYLGDGCSIGVVDLFIDQLPPYTPAARQLSCEPELSYEAMTVAYDLDE